MIATVCEQHLSDGCLLDARFMDLKRHGEELQNGECLFALAVQFV